MEKCCCLVTGSMISIIQIVTCVQHTSSKYGNFATISLPNQIPPIISSLVLRWICSITMFITHLYFILSSPAHSFVKNIFSFCKLSLVFIKWAAYVGGPQQSYNCLSWAINFLRPRKELSVWFLTCYCCCRVQTIIFIVSHWTNCLVLATKQDIIYLCVQYKKYLILLVLYCHYHQQSINISYPWISIVRRTNVLYRSQWLWTKVVFIAS